MPVPSIEQIQKKEAGLKKLIAEQGESMEAVPRRALGKKLRRAQRKRRRMEAHAARTKPKAAPAAAAEAAAPAEEPAAE